MKQRVGLLAAVILVACLTASAQGRRRDGNWWRGHNEIEKANYLTGFLDGMGIGALFAQLHVADTKCVVDADKSFQAASVEYFGNIVVGQVADGLNTLYNDFRNRSITVVNGVWIVAMQISGKPASEIEKEIEKLRREATQ